ncbi:RluA family pseudouridine synthase [Oscillospiraceae bacterium HV4-5-C5C]|nr:RluA family pseudouridine synthase [Oscillospiraceae bacterium HV4-5-C5C]
MHLVYDVAPEDNGKTALELLRQRLNFSAAAAKRVRLHGQLLCNGLPIRMIDPVPAGGKLDIIHEAPEQECDLTFPPQVGDIRLLWQDSAFLIVDKPAGMLTHPNYIGETHNLLSWLNPGLHPVTRLDRDTSGLIIMARNAYIHSCFTQKPMEKYYLGVVHGQLAASSGCIDLPIGRAEGSIIERKVSPEGRPSLTEYEVLADGLTPSGERLQLVRFHLLTGRTHQIRVHCAYLGHPLVGDTLYGHHDSARTAEDLRLGRQALHAWSLRIQHPMSSQVLVCRCRLPQDMEQLLEACQLDFLPAAPVREALFTDELTLT